MYGGGTGQRSCCEYVLFMIIIRVVIIRMRNNMMMSCGMVIAMVMSVFTNMHDYDHEYVYG